MEQSPAARLLIRVPRALEELQANLRLVSEPLLSWRAVSWLPEDSASSSWAASQTLGSGGAWEGSLCLLTQSALGLASRQCGRPPVSSVPLQGQGWHGGSCCSLVSVTPQHPAPRSRGLQVWSPGLPGPARGLGSGSSQALGVRFLPPWWREAVQERLGAGDGWPRLSAGLPGQGLIWVPERVLPEMSGTWVSTLNRAARPDRLRPDGPKPSAGDTVLHGARPSPSQQVCHCCCHCLRR